MNTFCIPIRVDDENDLYDGFLPSGLAFSGDLVVYLTDYIADRKPREKVCIEPHASDEPDMERSRQTYDAFVQKLIQRNKKEIAIVDMRAVIFMFLGIAFVVVGFMFADRIDRIATEIFAAAVSFALWGAISAFLETLPTLRHRRKQLQQVALKADIRFKREG